MSPGRKHRKGELYIGYMAGLQTGEYKGEELSGYTTTVGVMEGAGVIRERSNIS